MTLFCCRISSRSVRKQKTTVAMSMAFQHYNFQPPPAFVSWRSWILRVFRYDRNAAWQWVRVFEQVRRLAPSVPWLPCQLWNIVAGLVFAESARIPNDWEHNEVYWLENWMRDPLQQEEVPMHLAHTDDEPYLTRVGMSDADTRRNCSPGLYDLVYYRGGTLDVVAEVKTTFVGSVCDCAIIRAADLFLGLDIADTSNILELRLSIGGQDVHMPYVLGRRYKFKLRRFNGVMIDFFFHPELPVIPMVALPYHEVRMRMKLVDEALPAPLVGFVYAFMGDTKRRLIAQNAHFLNRQSTAPLHIHDGMAHYASQTLADAVSGTENVEAAVE